MTDTTHKTEAQARVEFAHYFTDLQEENARDGAHVSKGAEWDFFIAHGIAEGRFPPDAERWPCPRSLAAILRAAK
ncbi:MAG: hypothetical protein ACOYB0_08280 [Polynucleobacter sp.]